MDAQPSGDRFADCKPPQFDGVRFRADALGMIGREMALLLIGILVFAVPGWSQLQPIEAAYSFVQDSDFWLATSVNLMGIGLFVSRVRAPEAARWFGYGTQLLGVPALAVGLSDLVGGTPDLSTWANFGYAGWALGAALVDHVLDIEYRNPVNPAILIPYAATYYVAIGFQAAVLLNKDIVPWVIAGAACLTNVAASFYARAHESD